MGGLIAKIKANTDFEFLWVPIICQYAAIGFQLIDEKKGICPHQFCQPAAISLIAQIITLVALAIVLISLLFKYMTDAKSIFGMAKDKVVVHIASLWAIYFDLLIWYLALTNFHGSGKFHGYVKILLYIAFLPSIACILSFLRTWITQPSNENITYEVALTLTNILLLVNAMDITPSDKWREWRDFFNSMGNTFGPFVIMWALTVGSVQKVEVVSQLSYFMVAFCALENCPIPRPPLGRCNFGYCSLVIFMFGWLLLALIINFKEVFMGSQKMRILHAMGAFAAVCPLIRDSYYGGGDFRRGLSYGFLYVGLVFGVIAIVLFFLVIFGCLSMKPSYKSGSSSKTSV